jgi:MtN3 and saliva related transmembrane protein
MSASLAHGVADVLGYVGGGICAATMLPQICHTLRGRSARDVSLLMLLVNLSGLITVTAYGALAHLPPVYVPASVSVLLTTTMLALKLRYTTADVPEAMRAGAPCDASAADASGTGWQPVRAAAVCV